MSVLKESRDNPSYILRSGSPPTDANVPNVASRLGAAPLSHHRHNLPHVPHMPHLPHGKFHASTPPPLTSGETLPLSIDQAVDPLPPSSMTSVQPRRSSYTYNSPHANVPLSMKFMHKPARLNDYFKQANDPTRRNSLINAKLSLSSASVESTGELSPTYVPQLVRKKLGEILKPSLKEAEHGRSKSLPSTPTYKQVHFGGSTDVKYFKKKDRPTAISASNSPTLSGSEYPDLDDMDLNDSDYTDNESNFEDELGVTSKAVTHYPLPSHGRLVSWDLSLPNFPTVLYPHLIENLRQPVFLEKVFISQDKKFLLGHIAVDNLSFEKQITVRYSLDHWKSVIEIPTIYTPDTPRILKCNNYDRFMFKIPLETMMSGYGYSSRSLDDRKQQNTYNLCIRYATPSAEYWDNNSLQNYTIKLTKRIQTPTSRPTTLLDHSKKPKYSASYLKRIVSDSDVPTRAAEQPASPDFNDFVKNNYYISSPLLSSYNTRERDLEYEPLNIHPIKQSKYKFDLSSKREPDSSSETTDLNPHTQLDSKAYRELLDSFCFFSTPHNARAYSPDPSGQPSDTYVRSISSFLDNP